MGVARNVAGARVLLASSLTEQDLQDGLLAELTVEWCADGQSP